MVPAVQWITCQRECFQKRYLMYVYREKQNIALVSEEAHEYMQQLAGHLAS